MKFLLITILLISGSVFAQSPILGRWKTIDDETGKPKSIVNIFEKDGIVYGKIESIFRSPEEDSNPKCDKCSGDKKDQFIIGMQIMEGLKKESEAVWVDGKILDPNNGKTYSCKAEVIDNGQKLKLRGFIGISLIGRTQTWIREPAVAAQASSAQTSSGVSNGSAVSGSQKKN